MSPVIEKLLLQITYICLHITAQGKWHAHVHLSAHVRQMDVYIQPATQIYEDGHDFVYAFNESVYYQARNPQEPWTAEREQHAEHALQTMLASLEPFLATDSAEVAA